MKSFFIGIETTRHCNLRCAHCFRADLDEVSEIPLETVEKILVQAKAYNKPHIALTGGETTLHRNFVEILEMIIAHGYSFHFVTNGFNYKSVFKKLFHLLKHPLWKGVSVSLDGATKETHDAIRGEGSYERCLATIAIARSYDLEVVTQMVVHRGNRHEIEAMALLCSKMDASRLHIAHMQPTPHTVEHGLLHSPQEFREVEQEVIDLQGRFVMPIMMSAGYYDETPVAHCKFLKHGALNIDHAGKLTTCCQLSNIEGSVGEHDLVADLSKISLFEGHQKLLDQYQRLYDFRMKAYRSNSFQKIDNFHCWTCQKYFKKVEWMKDFPNNEWVQQDNYFKEHSFVTPLKVIQS